jgi:hypothetical protein
MATLSRSERHHNRQRATQRRWFATYAGDSGVVTEMTHHVLFVAHGLAYSLVIPVTHDELDLPTADGLTLDGPPLHAQRGQAGGHRGNGCRGPR